MNADTKRPESRADQGRSGETGSAARASFDREFVVGHVDSSTCGVVAEVAEETNQNNKNIRRDVEMPADAAVNQGGDEPIPRSHRTERTA